MPTSAAASSSSCSSQDCALASCALVSHRIQASLANESALILHRTQWQCLAKTYVEVLRALTDLLQHSCPLLGPPKLIALLHALLCAIQDGERCIEDCTPRHPTFTHSWLLEKALILGASTDVVNLHLHNFLWTFSALLNLVTLQLDSVGPDVVRLARTLSEIWACEDVKADLSEACYFLSTIELEENGETSLLAEFIQDKLSHAQDLESLTCDALPSYLWIDPSSLEWNSEVLGEGGYGKVHEAQWLGGRFAVKNFFYVENMMEFGREAAIQARLRHPNVISLICCTKNSALRKGSLIMELMQQDLKVLMMKRIEAGMDPPFSLGVAMDLMLQIACGMEYLHSLHIMHRDLKSSNILVGFSRRKCDADMDDVGPCAHLKIADFGMSKAKPSSSKYTSRQVGATAWRAPEVFEINPKDKVEGDINGKYTKKADVYSFGLVCYEILTGKYPFEGTQVQKRVLAGERPVLPSYCPLALSSFIERCWCAESSRRPTFSQICRMLRYFKAYIFLQDQHDQSSINQYSWLLHPLPPDVCARIDDKVISFVQLMGIPLQPQPVNILLEMHCCRLVLKEREISLNGYANDERDVGTTQRGAESNMSPQIVISINEQQKGVHGHHKSTSKSKSYLIYVFRSLKKLFCIQNTELAKSELQDALGLVRDYTMEELQLATADFSKVLGEGGTGKVYYGKLGDGREIAVKMAIRPKVLQSGRIISTSETMGLVQELRIASQLRHRNIVPFFGWCQDKGKLILVYEFMPNGNLARHIFGDRNSLNWQQMYKVICQLASALKYLHQDAGDLPIVHRDVKAANVLLDSEWNARLGDCGSAVLLRNGDASRQRLAGTYGYIAPESVTQNIVSPASDVYAFGITVFDIATGRRAYTKAAIGGIVFVRDWVWSLYQLGDLVKVANVQFGGKFEEDEMRRLLLLGLSCTSADPYMRPPIEEVIKILSGASEPPQPGAQTTKVYSASWHWSTHASSSSSHMSSSADPYMRLPTEPPERSQPGPQTTLAYSNSSPLFYRASTSSTGRHRIPFACVAEPLYGDAYSVLLTPRIEDELSKISSARIFTFKELKIATRIFWHGNFLGGGGFGNVYKGSIDEIGPTGAKVIAVAVKKLNAQGLQGHKEWLAEVHFLGRLQHPHLVKLIGYCCENEHRILVYEFMPNGSLENRLFEKATPQPLSWATRVLIALGAAKGLAFLHEARNSIIYRDLKPSNILLDSDLTAKLSDFGHAKKGPEGDETHISTGVKGTYGYTAPEYVMTGHLTWRSDVYSYGIVLLELLTGQRSIDQTRARGKHNLVEWARPYLSDKRKSLQIMDPSLAGMYSVKEARKAAALALQCLSVDPKTRPSMSHAVQTLESIRNMRDM